MPKVLLTRYEIEHVRMPAVCVRCGQPTDEHLDRTVRLFSGRWAGYQSLVLAAAVLFAPPLVRRAWRRIPAIHLRLPFCADDQARYHRQERLAFWILVPPWLGLVIAGYGYCLAELAFGRIPFQLLFTIGGLALYAVFMGTLDAVIGWWTQRYPLKNGLGLGPVHPAFVAALLEDRARDRVSNPDRRGGHGDVRDDFDDEPR